MDTSGKITKNVVIQWGETPTSVAYIPSSGQLLGWGLRAIEVRSAETGHLDGVFMHKREQRFKFLCERNDKVRSPVPSPDHVKSRATFVEQQSTGGFKCVLHEWVCQTIGRASYCAVRERVAALLNYLSISREDERVLCLAVILISSRFLSPSRKVFFSNTRSGSPQVSMMTLSGIHW